MPTARAGIQADRAVISGLAVATFGSAVLFLLKGAGFVLDDWYTLRNAHFVGAWSSAGAGPGAARPASRLVFALMFGVFERHPLPGVLLLAAINAASAILLYRLLCRLLDRWQAGLASLLWVILPTHISTEVWLTCVIIAVSQLALTLALHVGLRDDRRSVHLVLVAALLAFSTLSYEASMPMALAAAVALPYLLRRRLDTALIATTVATSAACSLWIVTHWFEGKSVQVYADPSKLVLANFGWGVTPLGAGSALSYPLVIAALICMTVAVVRVGFPSFQPRPDDWLIVAGVVVMVIGFAPFARYLYQPLGAGDRVNYLSAVGGALVWVGMVGLVARLDRRLAGAAVAVLVVLGLGGRWERIQLWSAAGHDADAIAEGIVAEFPDPDRTVVMGPTPVLRHNVAAYLDRSNIEGALALTYGRPKVDILITYSKEDFAKAVDELRFDIRAVSELDDVRLFGEG